MHRKTIEISEPGGEGVAERYEERVHLFSHPHGANLGSHAGAGATGYH